MARKTAVVVGSGRIGLAVQKHLANRYQVIAASHRTLELQDLRTVSLFFSSIPEIDLLVNAAGAYGAVGKVRSVPPEEWRKAGDILLTGVYACCHYALPKMPEGSHIITFAGGGKGPLEMRSGLAAAKAGIGRLNETLAAEEPQLFVNAIAPGPMYSRMHDVVVGLAVPWADQFRKLRSGVGEIPIENSLRAVDYILRTGVSGQLFFARDFAERGQAYG